VIVYVPYLFVMRKPLPNLMDEVWNMLPEMLRPRIPGCSPQERARRVRVGRWLGRLSVIGTALVVAIGGAAARAEDANRKAAWARVVRAMQWIRALRARLRAEARRARAAMFDPPEQLLDRPDRLTGLAPRAPRRKRQVHDCIEGNPDAVVFAGICADLHEAATRLGDGATAQKVAAIAEAARALFADAPPPPAATAETWWVDYATAATAAPADAAEARPPDTG
jgi:hypothetical protein